MLIPDDMTMTGDVTSVIENISAIQASGNDTTQAPVLSAGYADLQGTQSATWLQGQQVWPVDQMYSTWLIHDTTTDNAGNGSTSNPGNGSKPTCSMFECLV
jgi:hypothetical protein